jgi:hypothetical protein
LDLGKFNGEELRDGGGQWRARLATIYTMPAAFDALRVRQASAGRTMLSWSSRRATRPGGRATARLLLDTEGHTLSACGPADLD